MRSSTTLRRMLDGPEIVVLPGAYDALSARLAERAGFAAMFTTGWAFQFVGHVFEGKKPSFVDDRRNLVVGLLWWLKKAGVGIELDPSAQSAPASRSRPVAAAASAAAE